MLNHCLAFSCSPHREERESTCLQKEKMRRLPLSLCLTLLAINSMSNTNVLNLFFNRYCFVENLFTAEKRDFIDDGKHDAVAWPCIDLQNDLLFSDLLLEINSRKIGCIFDICDYNLEWFNIQSAENGIDEIMGVRTRLALFCEVDLNIAANGRFCINRKPFLFSAQNDHSVCARLHDLIKSNGY